MEFQFPMPLSYISTDSVLDYSYRRIIRLLMFFVNPPPLATKKPFCFSGV